jgi:hypothetical protein
MAPTRLADIVVPEVWNPYIIERTAELSALWQSGVVQNVAELDGFASDGGNIIEMPFWQDLGQDDEVVSATGAELTVGNITAERDAAVVLARGRGFGVNELAAALTGSDPAAAIMDLLAAWWARRFQAALIASLQGVFDSLGGESPAVNVLDIHDESGSAATANADTLLDAQQLLGDAKSRLTAIAMHSKTENALVKQGVIEFIQPQTVGPRIPMYQDKVVIVDDGLPVEDVSGVGDVYDTYLFGPGAFGFADGTGRSQVTGIETDRDAARGEDRIFTRRHFVLHPRGVRWNTASTGGGPANDAASPVPGLSDGDNWLRVYEPKNIRMVLLRHTI